MHETTSLLLAIFGLVTLGVYLLLTSENRYQAFRKAAKKGDFIPSSNNAYYINRGNKAAIMGTIKWVGWFFVLMPIVVLVIGFCRGGIFWQHFLR
jgi:hypothetical protein